jgi:3-hydroxyacyl-CoA dehydrogenase/enoyl-CoA hydratase/3-hydroxybutyryl-CoA epimerase
MMGSGIAAESTFQGMSTRVRDVNELALTGVQRYAQRVIANRSRTDAPLYGQRKIHGLSSSTGFEGIHGFDVVIEAVFEDAELKQALIRDVEPLMSPDAIFASNTSAIPISHLASVALHPERVIGMHFFSPVDRMKLLEIIPHVGTAKSVLATAISLGLALGKIPIVVSDSPGFFTSRVFGRWLDEGTRLITDGATINQIDSVAKKLGFPVGPLLAQDETSLLLLQRIANDPMTANITSRRVDLIAARRAIDTLVNAGHVGRLGRRGWYLYDENGRRGEPDESVYELIEINKCDVSDSEIADRLLYSFISEALLCLEEGIIQSPSDGDIASVFGIGFPRELGGPFKFVSSVGASAAFDTMKRLDNGTGNFVTSNSMHS